MKIQILYFKGCPHHQPATARVKEIVEALGTDASITQVQLSQDDDAGALHFLGSPTIQVNGIDIEPAARNRTDFGFSCRCYPDRQGIPPQTMIRQALLQAGSR